MIPALVAHADDIIVDNTDDAGAGSLRQAIADAKPGDRVVITATGTIALTSGQLEITETLTISGPGAGSLSISGNDSSRVFTITSGVDVTISGVTIRDGSATDGGGVYNRGTLTVTTTRQNGSVLVTFTDDGPGVSPENLTRIFDPFFTTKEAGKGTGLGLSICHGIVAEHGGQIYAASQPGRGATILIELCINGNNHTEAMR